MKKTILTLEREITIGNDLKCLQSSKAIISLKKNLEKTIKFNQPPLRWENYLVDELQKQQNKEAQKLLVFKMSAPLLSLDEVKDFARKNDLLLPGLSGLLLYASEHRRNKCRNFNIASLSNISWYSGLAFHFGQNYPQRNKYIEFQNAEYLSRDVRLSKPIEIEQRILLLK